MRFLKDTDPYERALMNAIMVPSARHTIGVYIEKWS